MGEGEETARRAGKRRGRRRRIGRRLPVLALVWALAACGSTADPPPEVPIGTEEGMRSPGLRGTLAGGETFSLEGAPGEPTVLVFYRSATCGLCRVQLEQIQRNLAAYRTQGAEVIGVTLDDPGASQSLVGEIGVDFPLVSVDSATFEGWDVLDPEHRVPLPATYVLDRDGLIRFRHIGRNASDRTTDAGVLTVLQRVSSE